MDEAMEKTTQAQPTLPEEAPQEAPAETPAQPEDAAPLPPAREDPNVTVLQLDGKEILLVATAHVSRESAELVKRVVEEERPNSVCIELDEGRYENMQHPDDWERTDVVKVIKDKKVGFMLANLALGAYQKKIAKQLDTKVGGEMLQGMESAKETGAQLVLADRPIQTTFLRIWRKLKFMEKAKLLYALILGDDESEEITDATLQELMQQDMLESVMSSMKAEFPSVGQVLIHERDQYLASKIAEAPGPKVVAVLGGAHVPGIKQEIFAPLPQQQMEEISTVPPKSKFSKLAGWVIPAIIVGIMVVGFASSISTGLQQLGSWVVWNAGLAGLFTALALGHPLSILTAAVAAPFTSLNPFFACGWFAGLVEAAIKKPTVQDIQNLSTDILSFKGFFKNRFLKILMVVIMANIGSTIGTFVAGTDMVRALFG